MNAHGTEGTFRRVSQYSKASKREEGPRDHHHEHPWFTIMLWDNPRLKITLKYL